MAAILNQSGDFVPPSAEDARLALEASERLARLSSAKSRKRLSVRISRQGAPAEDLAIPDTAVQLLTGILAEMAKGNAVTLIPIQAELTTQQAADILHVSRPFLVEQLENGEIPFRKVGTHRRVLLKDLLDYKQSIDQNRLKALEELSALDQELGFGY